jgi:hypothetical protein
MMRLVPSSPIFRRYDHLRKDATPARPNRRSLPTIICLAVVLSALSGLLASAAWAGKARDYLNAPVDSWVTFYNIGRSESVAPVVGGAEFGIPAATTDILSQSFILTRIIGVGGRTGGLSIILPHADIDVVAGPFAAGARAFGDLGLAAEVNLFGAPALSREAFKTWTPETFASVHLVATVPTGSFDADDPVNVGSNRWTLTPTINYSFTPDAGLTWLEAYGTVKLFGENEAGTSSLEQDPLYLIELHASRNVTPDLWFSADAFYDLGGETFVDGIGQENAADTLRLGVGLGLRLPSVGQLFIACDQAVSTPSGQPDTRALRLTLARVW